MSKRTLDDGIVAAMAILDSIATGYLTVGEEVTALPYPGIGVPPGRHSVEMRFVGSGFVSDILHFLKDPMHQRLLIDGCRGNGKSADLRAAACAMYACFGLYFPEKIVVCIWNLDAAVKVGGDVQVVKDALIFAYVVKYEGLMRPWPPRPPVGFEEEEENAEAKAERLSKTKELREQRLPERQAVLDEIGKVTSMKDAIAFVDKRSREHKEVFYFLADGWEIFDADKTDRQEKREKIQDALDELFRCGRATMIALSANSTSLGNLRGDTKVLTKSNPFNTVQYASYKADNRMLELLDQGSRSKDIMFYTGRVPWLLETLLDCCYEYGKQEGKQATLESTLGRLWIDEEPLTQPSPATLAHKLCTQDDAWEAVLKIFRGRMKVVRTSIAKIRLDPGERYFSMAKMGHKDKKYFLEEKGVYCSGYVQRLYIEGFMKMEELARQNARGVWIEYCQYLLNQAEVNWSALGWLAEDLVADVIAHRTVYLGPFIGNVNALRLQEFVARPVISLGDAFKYLKAGQGYFYKSLGYKLPYIDGLVLFMDADGRMHIVGLQVTLNVDRHLASAASFVQMSHLKGWFPGLAAHLDDPKVTVSFVYIGHSKLIGDNEQELPMPAKGKRVPAYNRIFVPFTKALGGDAGLNLQELKVVEEIIARRSNHFLGLQALERLTKAELVSVAAGLGIHLNMDMKKGDMLEQIVASQAEYESEYEPESECESEPEE